jgi:hypothetical protein
VSKRSEPEIPLLWTIFYSFDGTETGSRTCVLLFDSSGGGLIGRGLLFLHFKASSLSGVEVDPNIYIIYNEGQRHSQVGSLAGAAHLLNDNAGVLRGAP